MDVATIRERQHTATLHKLEVIVRVSGKTAFVRFPESIARYLAALPPLPADLRHRKGVRRQRQWIWFYVGFVFARCPGLFRYFSATIVAERLVIMKFVIVPQEEFAQAAGDYLVRRIFSLSSFPYTIGTATGGTMEGIYRGLVERALGDPGLLGSLRAANYFAMDEYVGLSADNPQSYSYFMKQRLLSPLGIHMENLRLPSEETAIPSRDAPGGYSVYDQMIAAVGGIDLQFAGIGENGHLAFNEPGSLETSWTRRIQLAPGTIQANARFFSDPSEVPCEAYTMGIQTILNAKSVILFASGKKKARAVQRMIEGLPGSDCPASFLVRHNDVTVFLDWDAAADLRSGLNK
jgi:glucosamine-6-phosphate deaminase